MIGLRDPVVYSLPGNEALAVELSAALHAEPGLSTHRTFPDGESYVRLVTNPRDRDVVIVATQRDPDPQLLRLVFAADAARALGARRVGLVAPYLAYMRQDRSFHTGEAVSARMFARLLSRQVDWLVTVDPHLHRVTSLAELFDIPAIAVDVTADLGAWVLEHIHRPLIIGPDAESAPWATAVAEASGAPMLILEKVRLGNDQVRIDLPASLPSRELTPVLVDDIVSTGTTMIRCAELLGAAGFRRPACVAVHAVFAGDAFSELQQAGMHPIVSTDTIVHSSNALSVVPRVAQALCAP